MKKIFQARRNSDILAMAAQEAQIDNMETSGPVDESDTPNIPPTQPDAIPSTSTKDSVEPVGLPSMPAQPVPLTERAVPPPPQPQTHSVPLLGERGSIIQSNPVTCSTPPIVSHPGVSAHTASTHAKQQQAPPLAGHPNSDVILTELKRDDHLLQQFSYNPNSHSYQNNQS